MPSSRSSHLKECLFPQHHEVPGVKAEVQGELAALRRHGCDRAVLGGPPGHAVPHQEPAVQASARSL